MDGQGEPWKNVPGQAVDDCTMMHAPVPVSQQAPACAWAVLDAASIAPRPVTINRVGRRQQLKILMVASLQEMSGARPHGLALRPSMAWNGEVWEAQIRILGRD